MKLAIPVNSTSIDPNKKKGALHNDENNMNLVLAIDPNKKKGALHNDGNNMNLVLAYEKKNIVL